MFHRNDYKIDGVKVYGLEGSGYYHTYNLSLSGGKGRASCRRSRTRLSNDEERDVEASICRATAVPLQSNDKKNNSVTIIAYLTPTA